MESKWIFMGKPFREQDIQGSNYGFVYKITDKDSGDFYIGSKAFYSRTNPKVSKKRSNELYKGKGRKPTRESKIKMSDWATYLSSSKTVKELISMKGFDSFIFHMVKVFNTKQEMLLYEAWWIAEEFLDYNPKILNEWVSVKSFKLK